MYVRFSAAEQSEVWDRFEAGESQRVIARAIGRSQRGVGELIAKTGGIRPLSPTVWSDARLSLTEREEISRGIVAGESCPSDCRPSRARSLDDLPRDRSQRRSSPVSSL